MRLFPIPKLLDKLQEYLKVKGDQLKLEVMGQTAKVLSYTIIFIFTGLIALFFGFFIGLAFAVYLNEVFDSQYLGYFIISGAILLILVVLLILLKTGKIQRWIEVVILKIGNDG